MNLEDEDTARMVFSAVRAKAKDKLTGKMVHALYQYVAANDGFLPAELSQLQPYITKSLFIAPGHVDEVIDPSVDETMLQRYEILQTGKLAAVPPDDVLVIAEKTPVDERFDTRVEIGKYWMKMESDPKAYFDGNGSNKVGPSAVK